MLDFILAIAIDDIKAVSSTKNNFLENIESNDLIDRLPKHLKQFIKPQTYEHYSPIDQAVWRYVMRKNVSYLSKIAHESYLKGLDQAGISTENIPTMYGMNRILKEIGWAAVAVDGFIPPHAFMEFQAFKVLVIASDIRQLEHIEYTPSPDIIHESAGHAPIIANPDYAEYLRRLGAIGAKAILSKHDLDLYEAVRKLSILKEALGVEKEEIERAEKAVELLQNKEVAFSEMAQIRNLQWWTVEYGLIGDLDTPKIYGAGLLSSIGESKSCMQPEVKKLPYSLDAANQGFDITKSQPQLYITPSFAFLMEVLEEFADTLSLRVGGKKGLEKLIASQMVGTIELNTGLQISGKFSNILADENGKVIFFKTEGPTALAYREKELIGHGTAAHAQGFSSPLGKLKGINKAIEDLNPKDLQQYNFYDGKWLSFEFDSGIKVEGENVTGIRNEQGKLLIIQLTNCTITYKDKILYKPEFGVFDMIVGSEIISAFAGAADANSFPNLYEVSETVTIKKPKTEKQMRIEEAYQSVRKMRESRNTNEASLQLIFEENKETEWLLLLEIYELSMNKDFRQKIALSLENLIVQRPQLKNLIKEGIELVNNRI